MVWSLDSGKRRADSTQYSTSPPLTVKLEVEKPLDEKRVRLHKRIRDASTSCEQALYNNVLGELGPLGLRPRKGRSLADISQMMLSQANVGKTLCFTSLKGSEVGEQSDFSASPSSLSKIKASNFPTSLLRIGTRKCVSRYEGDLVAKCYFAKHKLTETQDSFERTLDFDSQDTPSPCSVEDTSLSCDALFDKEITDFIPQFFDIDSQSSAVSDEQSIISRGNSLCCLLQQNTVGRMNSGKRRADSTQHSTPPTPAVKLEVEEPLDEKRVRLHKRIRDASTSCEQALYNNVLGELGPLGLHPRKSQSLADMSQMMLSQANAGKTLCFTSLKGLEVCEQSDFSASPSSLSKIEASNFPTSLLRIGTWKYVSRYEADLVAKCYFAKHKLGQFPLLPTLAKYSGQNGLFFKFRQAPSIFHPALGSASSVVKLEVEEYKNSDFSDA
ncbi:hypothetical protein ZIOFF_013436 [Zingiber officinale]|uniref:TRF2/HOY1 PH-like domain-containing protein n=1 Tax=Zingiber officinale TaxID=94328 RepID=A0A8J5LNV4_ZINOF|nr:hypothetical protein ZIOFF_013436 [Zingiber officinale]